MRFLIIDPIPSVSGDMFLAAASKLGFDLSKLEKIIQNAGFPDFKIKLVHKKSGHISASSLKFHPYNLPSLELKKAIKIVKNLKKIEDKAREIAIRIIENLIAAEKKFHSGKHHKGEIYSLDTLVDALGVGLIITDLEIERCVYTQIYIPRGINVDSEYPLLAPATLEILKEFELTYIDINQEIITPTGASILTTLCNPDDKPDYFCPVKVGYSTGSKKFSHQNNLLRLILSQIAYPSQLIWEEVYELITSVDDITPEELAYVQEKLFSAGALDVQILTYYGKKNRVGFTIVILCKPAELHKVVSILFKHTPTGGIRYHKIPRFVLPREVKKRKTPIGEVTLKKFYFPHFYKEKFEFNHIKQIADKENLPLSEVKKILKK